MTASFWNGSGIPPEDGPYAVKASNVVIVPSIAGLTAENAQDAFGEIRLDLDEMTALIGTKLNSQMNTARLLGRTTAGTGPVEELAAATARTLLGLGTAALQNTGTSGANVPLLNGANTWSAQQTLNGALSISAAAPQLYFGETDQGTNLKNWRMWAEAGAFQLQLLDDAFATPTSVFSVTRTAHTAATFTLPSTTTCAMNGAFFSNFGANFAGAATTFQSNISMDSTAPLIDIRESDGGTNTKRWRFGANANMFNLELVDDAYSAATSVFSIGRTAHTAATLTYPATTTLNVNGPVVFGNAATTFNASPTIANTTPQLDWWETDGGTNTQRWRERANANGFALEMVNDAYSAFAPVYTVSRTAHTSAVFTFPSTTTPVFAAPPIISSTNPQLRFQDTDASANEKEWRFNVNGQFMEFQTGTDAFVWDTAWFMQRSAGVVTGVQFNKPTQVNSAFTCASSLNLANTFPLIATFDSDAGTDAKRWRWQTDSGVHSLRIGTDADTGYISVYDVTRSTNVSATFSFPSTTGVVFNGTTTATVPFDISSNAPTINLLEGDAGTNLKRWRYRTDAGLHTLQILDDAGAGPLSVYEVSRTANTAATLTLPTTTRVTFSGATVLANNVNLSGRNAANNADIAIARVNTSDRVEIAGDEVIPWTAWTPTITVINGTVDSNTPVYSRWRKQHKTVFFELSILVTPNAGNGATTSAVRFTTPVTPSRDAAAGSGWGTVDGHAYRVGVTTGGFIEVYRTNSGSPLRDTGNTANQAPYIVISGFYEVAS